MRAHEEGGGLIAHAVLVQVQLAVLIIIGGGREARFHGRKIERLAFAVLRHGGSRAQHFETCDGGRKKRLHGRTIAACAQARNGARGPARTCDRQQKGRGPKAAPAWMAVSASA